MINAICCLKEFGKLIYTSHNCIYRYVKWLHWIPFIKKKIIADKLTKINYFCLVFLLLINWISSAIEKVPKFGDKIITISESLLQSHSSYPYGQCTCNISPRNVSLIAIKTKLFSQTVICWNSVKIIRFLAFYQVFSLLWPRYKRF